MKKALVISTILMSAMSIESALAAGSATTYGTVALTANGFVSPTRAATEIGDSQSFNMQAIANRAGFVKNDFHFTLSAQVTMGVVDATNRFAVIAASSKGRNVFTGTSDGGSVNQCGAPVSGVGTDLASTLVVTGSLNADGTIIDGCNR